LCTRPPFLPSQPLSAVVTVVVPPLHPTWLPQPQFLTFSRQKSKLPQIPVDIRKGKPRGNSDQHWSCCLTGHSLHEPVSCPGAKAAELTWKGECVALMRQMLGMRNETLCKINQLSEEFRAHVLKQEHRFGLLFIETPSFHCLTKLAHLAKMLADAISRSFLGPARMGKFDKSKNCISNILPL